MRIFIIILIATGGLLPLAAQTPPVDAKTSLRKTSVLVEAEAFDELGGWILDQQFMDLMGSPFLLAHGMGRPVADARTRVDLPRANTYRVWVRTRDWVAPWKAPGSPGKFAVLLNGEKLAPLFGVEGEPWHWQDGGTVELGRQVHVSLRDLTGFDGRCDALLFCSDLEFRPPENLAALETYRDRLAGRPAAPVDGGDFDLVVVGGGIAGTAAAVTAARRGLEVALIQDRPVLGGNASSEVRVWPEGHVNQMPYPRVGDVVMEIVPPRGRHSANAQAAAVFDDDRKLRLAAAEPNLTLFLERRMNAAQDEDGRVVSVTCEHVRFGDRLRIRGRWFLDSTGDAALGALVGADFEQTDRGHMGASNLWNIKCLCEDEDALSSRLESVMEEAKFPRCPWAVDLSDSPFPGRSQGAKIAEAGANPISLGNWFWESGFDRDPIRDMERVRDQNLRAAYGAWDAIKNVEGRYPAHRLNWVAYIAGKRESRRLLGDLILRGEDLRAGRRFQDGCVPCTWGIDTHHPDPRYARGHEGEEFIADYTRGRGFEYEGPYWLPYRCLYSRNVRNLFMAGRDISVTHEALGAVRVMKTTGAMGEIVGMAAAICKGEDCDPREVYSRHLDKLLASMRKGAGREEPLRSHEDGTFVLEAARARVRGRQARYEKAKDSLGYWRSPGDYAEWSLRIPQPGPRRYRVLMRASCPASEAGGQVEIRDGLGRILLSTKVASSSSWEIFEDQILGSIEVPAGDLRLCLVNRKAEGPLMKLRQLQLSPLD
jgi:FAD-dependent oxidoreductase family protein